MGTGGQNIRRGMESKTYKGVVHYIYPLEEFLGKYPKIRPIEWREGGVGDWVMTDDGSVCQILYIYNAVRQRVAQTFVKTITGTYIKEQKVPMDSVIKKDMGLIVPLKGRSVSRSGHSSRLMRTQMSKGDWLFAKSLLVQLARTDVHEDREDMIITAFKKAFPDSRSERYIQETANSLYKTTRIQKVLNKEIQETLEEKKVTFAQLCDWMKSMMEDDAMTMQGNAVIPAQVKFNIINKFADWLGVQSETKQTEQLAWYESKGRLPDREMKKITATKSETKTEVGQ